MNFLRRYVFHDFGLKLLSLAIAVLLWWTVAREPVAETVITTRFEFHHPPENLVLATEDVPVPQVRVRGRANVVRALPASEVQPMIDLHHIGVGTRTFDVESGNIHVPRGVEVMEVVPSQVTLTFDRTASREVKVMPRVSGQFASGVRIARVTAEPETVTVFGPEQRVHAIETALTDPVDATGLIGRATFTTNVAISDSLVRVSRPAPIRVTVVTERANGAKHP